MQIEIDEVTRRGEQLHRAKWRCPRCSRSTERIERTFLRLVMRLQDERGDRRCHECRAREAQGALWK